MLDRKRFLTACFIAAASLLGVFPHARAAGSNPNQNIDTSMSDEVVAQTLVGPGVLISHVHYSGAADARGTFSFVDPNVLGTSQGVILSSGKVHDVVGPNTSDSFSTDWTNNGDPELDVLSGFQTFDAAVLEFDFVPDANQVTFQYAFASDEYSEFVNTPYNDVFAFFINGANCAEVRQTAGDPAAPFVPVAVNNINDSNPVQDPPPPPMRADLFRANTFDALGTSLLDLELDGITRVLTCQATVVPGEVNHMKLAIADASDGVYDSAVFIQAGSLVSNEDPTADLGLDPDSGAAPLNVTATVEGHDPNDLPLTFTIDWGDGSATPSQPLTDLTAVVGHTYVFGGEFIVTLTVSNGSRSGTDREDVHVTGPSPTPSPTPTVTATPTVTPTPTPTASPTPSSTAVPVADPYLCYRVTRAAKQPKFVQTPLVVQDALGGPLGRTATSVASVCNPATVNGTGVANPAVHQEQLKLRTPKGSPKFVKSDHVVTDRFATRKLTLRAVDGLLDVTPLALGATPPAPFASDPTSSEASNRFTCYRATMAKGEPKFAPPTPPLVADELLPGEALDLKRITKLCLPADVGGATPGAATRDARLVCYRATRAKGAPKFVRQTVASNATTGAHVLVATGVADLCVPATETAP